MQSQYIVVRRLYLVLIIYHKHLIAQFSIAYLHQDFLLFFQAPRTLKQHFHIQKMSQRTPWVIFQLRSYLTSSDTMKLQNCPN